MLALFSALLQVNEDLKTIGALAGLLAVPGLAVLSLLYFGQAREVRRLRDWAGRAPERAAELEQRVTTQAQQRAQAAVTAPSTPAAQAATGTAQPKPAAAPGGNGVAKPAPGAPATVAAQAATAGAEKKDGDEAAAEKKEGEEATPDEVAADAEKKDAAGEDKKAEGEEKADEADAGKKDEAKEPVAAAAAGPPTTASPAATPAGAAAGAGAAAAATAAARARGASPPIPPRPAQPARANAPSATMPPRTGARRPGGGFTEPPRSSRVSRNGLIGIGAAVLVLLITVAIVLKVTGGSDNSPTPAPNTVAGSPSEQQGAGGQTTAPAVSKAQRAQTNVAVLNGTTVTGLARSVASRLQDQGYTVGNVTDAPNQAQPQTKVEYGSGHRDEATALATAIKVPPSRVVALSPVDSTTAGPNAEVVVVVGQDSAR